jgi:oligopeptide transport system permease protein
MMRFIVRRAVWLVLTLWIVFTLSFFLMRNTKGSPLDRSDRKLDASVRQLMEERYGLNKPLHIQYWDALTSYLRGDLGYSLVEKDKRVDYFISSGLPISATLGLLALSLAIVIGVTIGVLAALRRGRWLDTTLMGIATLGIALPNFVLASLAVLLFAFVWRWFPPAGWGTLEQLILPVACLAAPYAAYIARLTRTSMLEVLGQDYLRTAMAKGLSPSRIIIRHALRGALLPVVTYLGPASAGILTGSLVIEQVFGIPGLGTHFVQAALTYDYTLCMGLVLLYTLILYTLNFLVDLSYSWLDPRVKLE